MKRADLTDLLSRACVGVLFLFLTINLLNDFVHTGRVTGLLFVVSESLVVILTIVRRHARFIDRSAVSAVLTVTSVAGPPLLRAADAPALASDELTAVVSGIGVLLVIVAKMTLGRSFGIVPANRGVVTKGPYSIVRHPIYAGYLITHVAFAAAYPTGWNLAVILIADSALIARALAEEHLLAADDCYQTYCARVSWHLVPGVF
ncbi:MAG TPA: methyltransferase [Vicinamibacterales bacterium]|nr:methyltransferase [Vicinamibacterales bacterium]